MRRIPLDIQKVVNSPFQTEAIGTKLTSVVEIKRPYTVLTDDYFLEKLELDTGSVAITDTDIAVSHPTLAHPNEDIFITTVQGGKARVYEARSHHIMDQHIFVDLGYERDAVKVALGFEASLAPTYKFDQERITENKPWWFYTTSSGELIGIDLNTEEEFTIVNENVNDVSVVSGPWHFSNDFDYGMIVFFIASGTLMCRRLIKGKWYNAEVISFGPGGLFTSVTATLTWDYRVCITVTGTDGKTHTIFTNFLGLGKFATELVELNDTDSSAKLTPMEYLNRYNTENVKLNLDLESGWNIIATRGPSYPVKVENIKSTNVEWGKTIKITFNLPIISNGFNIANAFSIEGSGLRDHVYLGGQLNSDGTVQINFKNFNDLKGDCTLRYTPGVMNNEFNIACESWSFTFSPINLNGNSIPYSTDTFELGKIEADHKIDLIPMQYLKSIMTDTVDLSVTLESSGVLTNISDL